MSDPNRKTIVHRKSQVPINLCHVITCHLACIGYPDELKGSKSLIPRCQASIVPPIPAVVRLDPRDDDGISGAQILKPSPATRPSNSTRVDNLIPPGALESPHRVSRHRDWPPSSIPDTGQQVPSRVPTPTFYSVPTGRSAKKGLARSFPRKSRE